VTPYYDDGKGIVIYNGDCREVMPELGRFDLLLTDPPYGIEWNTNYSRFTNSMQAAPRVDHPAIINDETDEMMSLALSWEGMKIVWGAHLSPWLIKERGSWLVWDKRFAKGKAMLADAELAYYSKGTGVYIHKHTWQGMIGDKSGTPRKRLHPNEKPVGLMRWCLTLLPDAKTVLDICCGSGTTLVAAKLEGRSATGIEISEKYCEIAANRLRQGVLDFGGDA
jgi:site-specific DNA-methyltransferase (adenine-specific)